MIEERLLHFNVYGDSEHTEIRYAVDIANKFVENDIDYACYFGDSFYKPEFYVRRSGKKWNDIIQTVNSVKPCKYNYKKETFYISNKKRDGVLGNLQLIETVRCLS